MEEFAYVKFLVGPSIGKKRKVKVSKIKYEFKNLTYDDNKKYLVEDVTDSNKYHKAQIICMEASEQELDAFLKTRKIRLKSSQVMDTASEGDTPNPSKTKSLLGAIKEEKKKELQDIKKYDSIVALKLKKIDELDINKQQQQIALKMKKIDERQDINEQQQQMQNMNDEEMKQNDSVAGLELKKIDEHDINKQQQQIALKLKKTDERHDINKQQQQMQNYMNHEVRENLDNDEQFENAANKTLPPSNTMQTCIITSAAHTAASASEITNSAEQKKSATDRPRPKIISNVSVQSELVDSKKKIENLEKLLKDAKKIEDKYKQLKKDNEKLEKKYKELKKKYDVSEKEVLEFKELNKQLQRQLLEKKDEEKADNTEIMA